MACREEEKKALKAAKRPPPPKPLPQGFFDAKPAKSILKNSGKPPVNNFAVPSSSKASTPAVPAPKAVPKAKEPSPEPEEEGELPEGFFDDPKKDAKVSLNVMSKIKELF